MAKRKNKNSNDALQRILGGHQIPNGVRGQLQTLIRNQAVENSALKGQASALQDQLSALQGQLSALQSQLSALRAQPSALQNHPNPLVGKVSGQKAEINSLLAKIKRLEGELKDARKDDNDLARLLAAGAGLFDRQSDEVKKLEAQLQREQGGRKRAQRRFAPELTAEATGEANEGTVAFKTEESVESSYAQEKTEAGVNGKEKEATASLLLGNLSLSVSEARLTQIFEEFGKIQSVRVITDGNGNSIGCGYVHFTTAEAGARAFEARDGCNLDGRDLHITFDDTAPVLQQRQAYHRPVLAGGFGRYSGMENVWRNYLKTEAFDEVVLTHRLAE